MRAILTMFVLWVCSLSLFPLAPPRPGELDRYRSDGTLAARQAFAEGLGNHRFAEGLLERLRWKSQKYALMAQGRTEAEAEAELTPPPAWRGMPTTGNVRIFALLIEFTDEPSTYTAGDIHNRIFGDGAGGFPYESLRNFYRRSSLDLLEIGGATLGWYRTAYPRTSVSQTDTGREALIREALVAMDAAGHDFSVYDNNGDGAVDYFMVFWTGEDNGWANFWWAYQTTYGDGSLLLDGKRLRDYSWMWESNPPGGDFEVATMIHETGHALGLPDYYDYNDSIGPQGGCGGLDMMDAAYLDHNAFSKFLLDWMTPSFYAGGDHVVSLRAAAGTTDAAIFMPGIVNGTLFGEFFLVQNRRRTGNDLQLPADGLVIWHVDSRLNASGNNFVYDNSYTAHKLLRLMEADGLEEIETGNGWADAGDFYTAGRTIGPGTLPSSNRYDGSSTGMGVDTVSAPGNPMTCRIFQCVPPAAPNSLQVTATTAHSVSLSWSGVPGVSRYRVYRDGNPAWSGSVTATTLEGLKSSTHYCFTVSAQDSCGEGPASPPVCADTDNAVRVAFCAHAVSSPAWQTRLHLVNTGSQAAALTLEGVRPDGTSAGMVTTPALGASSLYERDLAEIFPPEALTGDLWVKVSSETDFRGVVEFGTRDGKSATVLPLAGSPSREAFFPYVYVSPAGSGSFYTGITLVNPGSQAAALTLGAADENGAPLAATTMSLAPGEKYVKLVDQVFPGVTDPTTIRSVTVSADAPLVGFELFGKWDQPGLSGLMAADVSPTALQAAAGPSPMHFFEIPDNTAWFTGVTFCNLGAQSATLQATLRDAGGQTIAQAYFGVNPRQQITREIWSLFGLEAVPEAASLRVESAWPTAGFELVASRDADPGAFRFDGLPAVKSGGERLVFPLVKPAPEFATRVSLLNLAGAAVTYAVKAFSAAGQLLGTAEGSLPARGRVAAALGDLFPTAAEVAWLQVDASGAVAGSLSADSADGTRRVGYLGLP
ncbi:MAG: M6 family metalloprotease domain-containing protein [Acidobacteria bacterium]|nr:M6 family metalloprotease domain-containing protein [Acidobacteriota bacterium]